MKTYLDRAPMLHSQDVAETRDFLARKAIGLDVLGKASAARAMDTHLNGVYLSGLWIGYIRYGAPVSVKLTPESSVWRERCGATAVSAPDSASTFGHYWVHFPLQGEIAVSLGAERLECNEAQGVIASPTGPHVLNATSSTIRLSLEIRGDSLQRQLATLLGHAVDRPLVFDPALALDRGHGRRLASLLRFSVGEIDRLGLSWSPLLAAEFERFMLTNLLLSQPSNYTEALRRSERSIAPRDVRRTIEYMHENLAEGITLADLVAVSGVAGRTLEKHFLDFEGVGPMRYLRNLRLDRVREDLAGGATEQVIEAAERWGFVHAGRFAIEYRRHFGECPSATLARRRGRLARHWLEI